MNTRPPIETGFGVYMFKLAGTEPGSVKSFDEIKEGLINSLKSEKAVDELFDIQNTIDDELAAGATIGEIAAVLSTELKTVSNVSIEGIMPDGNASNDLPLIVDFLDVAFQNNIGDELEINESIGNKFYMLSVENIVDSVLKPFDDVKNRSDSQLVEKPP